jgi:tight adherence protein B
MILGITFALLVLISFSVVLLLIRPRSSEKQMTHRLHLVLGPSAHVKALPIADLALSNVVVRGPFSWIEDLLQHTAFLRRLKQLLHQSKSSWQAGTLIAITTIAAMVSALAVYAITGNLLLSVPCALACIAAPLFLLRWRRERHIAAFNAVLPDAIEMCARSLRAGHSVIAAIGIVAEEAPEPAKSEFAEVFRKQNYGVAMRDALIQMLDHMPSPDLRMVVTAILVQKDTGGNLAEIMDRVVSLIRDRIRIQAEVRVHTAQGRFTGWVLCLLPIALLLLINFISPGYSRVLFQDGPGRKLLYTGAALLTLGAYSIRHIIHGIEV